MKPSLFAHKRALCTSMFASSVLLAASSVSALQNQTHPPTMATQSAVVPGSATLLPAVSGTGLSSTQAMPGHTRSDQTTLTPAAPVSSTVPASSEEDIRDIRQPRHLPTPIAWFAVAAGVIFLATAACASWRWFRRRKLLGCAPYEIALQQLEDARRLMDSDQAREYCFAVSEIIRNYLELQFHLHAPRLTTEEFLRDLVEVRETMLASHRSLLGDFLQHCDLAKFAGWRYSKPALEEMHGTAADFVRQTGRDAVRTGLESPGAGRRASANPTPTTASAPELAKVLPA
jgi:hypothetical protein